MAEVGFSLGSNLGDKGANLRDALARLAALPETLILKVSPFYRTAPWGRTDQDWFVNACAIGETGLDPQTLIRAVKDIEATLGRIPGERWGPRLIDVDILYMDDLQVDQTNLKIPHPSLFDRAFVLLPLADIAPGRTIKGRRVGDAAAALPRTPGDVVRLP